MQNTISRKTLGIMLLWIMLVYGCASSLIALPNLNNRNLEIDVEKAGFSYGYKKCYRNAIGIRKCKFVRDFYDFCNDESVRKQLSDLDFVLGKRLVP